MGNKFSPGCPADEGMRIFVVAENFMAWFHMIVMMTTYADYVSPIWLLTPEERHGSEMVLNIMLIFYVILIVSLFFQIIIGVLLTRLGFLKRNVKICVVWIIIACLNLSLPLLVLLLHLFLDKRLADGHYNRRLFPFWTPFYTYLLYHAIGIDVVYRYRKWVVASGTAGQSLVASGPPDPALAVVASIAQPGESREIEREMSSRF